MLRQQYRCSELEIGALTHIVSCWQFLLPKCTIFTFSDECPSSLSNLNIELTGNQGKVRCAWSTEWFWFWSYNAQNSNADKARLLSQTHDQCILWCQARFSKSNKPLEYLGKQEKLDNTDSNDVPEECAADISVLLCHPPKVQNGTVDTTLS